VSVLWEHELDARVIEDAGWHRVGEHRFDDPELFAAYARTVRWGCVTATDPSLFQAPFRAGIQLDAYQLEPLRKALLLPRVNLLIADDVGLGKTIETGLVMQELMLRHRARSILIVCPSSIQVQWKEEMRDKFGLDSFYVKKIDAREGQHNESVTK
jgi:SNF2 family DNA or RNA helicase